MPNGHSTKLIRLFECGAHRTGFTGYTGTDLGVVPTSWTIQQLGDFNGDGKADIAWRNSDGTVDIWMSNTGTGFTGLTGQMVGVVGNDWHIV